MRVTSPSPLSAGPVPSVVRARRSTDSTPSPAVLGCDILPSSGFTGAPLRIGRASQVSGSSRSSSFSVSAIAYPRADSPHDEGGAMSLDKILYTSEELLMTSSSGKENVITASFVADAETTTWAGEDEPMTEEKVVAAQAKSASGPIVENQVQEHVWVNFEVQYESKFGQGLFLVGEGDESLGGWQTGMPMKWTEGEDGKHVWQSQLLLPSGHSISYKYVVRSFDDLQGERAIKWQPGENRQLDIPKVVTGDGRLAHKATIATGNSTSITFCISKDSLIVHDSWVGEQVLSWGRVRPDLVEEMAVELERHNVVELPASPKTSPPSSPPQSPRASVVELPILDMEDMEHLHGEELESALAVHIEEYEETNDLLDDLAELVNDVQAVYHSRGKTSLESFTVDRAVAAAVDAALFLVQKQGSTLIGNGGGSVRNPSALPDGAPRP